jgi:hypothetical protein
MNYGYICLIILKGYDIDISNTVTVEIVVKNDGGVKRQQGMNRGGMIEMVSDESKTPLTVKCQMNAFDL